MTEKLSGLCKLKSTRSALRAPLAVSVERCWAFGAAVTPLSHSLQQPLATRTASQGDYNYVIAVRSVIGWPSSIISPPCSNLFTMLDQLLISVALWQVVLSCRWQRSVVGPTCRGSPGCVPLPGVRAALAETATEESEDYCFDFKTWTPIS